MISPVPTNVSSIWNTKSKRTHLDWRWKADFDFFSRRFSLEEDKRALEKEKARIPNQSDIDEKMKNLHKDCEELRRQIAQKNSEITDHTILLTDKRKKFGVTTRQHEELTHTQDGLEVALMEQWRSLTRCFVVSGGISASDPSTRWTTQAKR
jgi:hypothetical protein